MCAKAFPLVTFGWMSGGSGVRTPRSEDTQRHQRKFTFKMCQPHTFLTPQKIYIFNYGDADRDLLCMVS
jgi:hypothetical protein